MSYCAVFKGYQLDQERASWVSCLRINVDLLPTKNPCSESQRTAIRVLFQSQCRFAGDTKDQFHPEDHVWLEARNLALPYQTCKLAPKFHGPFLITKRVLSVAYQLQLPPTWTIHDMFHASLLTPYHETIKHGPNYNRPPPEMVNGEEEFKVEAMMGHHFFGKGHKLQYLIKWNIVKFRDMNFSVQKGLN